MSAALDRLKQQNEQDGQRQQPGSPETMEALTSILAAVEAQNARLDRLTEQQKKLAGLVKVMDEETTRRLERITPLSTSLLSSDVSTRIASIESRQNEIASTLGEFAQSLNGESLNAASQSLIAEAQKNHVATTSAIEKLTVQADESRMLVSKVGGAMQRIEKRAAGAIEQAADRVADRVGVTITAHQRTEGDRAERLQASNDRLEAQKLWSVAAAMCLILLPVAVVVAGIWMSVAGLITGAQWALDVDGSVWLGIGRWLVVAVGLVGAGYGLLASVRWIAGLVEAWKGRGMPKLPRWGKP